MKKSEVEIGRYYIVKVSGKLTRVKILRESPYGGWEGVNAETGRAVRIKTAARLRKLAYTDQEREETMRRMLQPLADLAAVREFAASHPNVIQ